jgi:hypothetical protein
MPNSLKRSLAALAVAALASAATARADLIPEHARANASSRTYSPNDSVNQSNPGATYATSATSLGGVSAASARAGRPSLSPASLLGISSSSIAVDDANSSTPYRAETNAGAVWDDALLVEGLASSQTFRVVLGVDATLTASVEEQSSRDGTSSRLTLHAGGSTGAGSASSQGYVQVSAGLAGVRQTISGDWATAGGTPTTNGLAISTEFEGTVAVDLIIDPRRGPFGGGSAQLSLYMTGSSEAFGDAATSLSAMNSASLLGVFLLDPDLGPVDPTTRGLTLRLDSGMSVPTAVPEPAGLALVGVGLAVMPGVSLRRRRRRV